MKDKPRALILGGMAKNIPNELRRAVEIRLHVTTEEIRKFEGRSFEGKYDVLIVITRYAPGLRVEALRKLVTHIPVLHMAGGWPKMRDELIRHGFLCNDVVPSTPRVHAPAVPTPEPQPAPVPRAEAPPPETTGLPPEELWRIYGQKAIDSVRAVLKPKEKVLEDDLCCVLSTDGGVGLPLADMKALLPELAVRGIIVNVDGKWKLASSDDVEYEHDDGKKEPKRTYTKRTQNRTDERLANVRGLPMGPYESRAAIIREMAKYRAFDTNTGRALGEQKARKLIALAVDAHIIEEHHGKLYVDHDPNLTLMPVAAKAVIA